MLSEGLALTTPIRGDPPPDNSRRHGRTNLLHRATNQGNYTIVSELLKTGYRHEAKNQNGQTAVHLASMNGKDDILRKLIEYGASVNSRDTAGYTPLHVRISHQILIIYNISNLLCVLDLVFGESFVILSNID